MKKLFIICSISAGTALTAQDYAKNSFGLNTSGPFPAAGLQWNHQLSEKTTLTAFYGQAVEADGLQMTPIIQQMSLQMLYKVILELLFKIVLGQDSC